MRETRAARRGQPLREHTVVATTDVDDAQQALSATFLPVRLHPQSVSSGLDTRLNAIVIERTRVGYLRLGADIRVVADEVTNYHVNVALTGKSRSKAGGGDEVLTVPGTAVAFTPGRPAEVSWTDDTEQMCLMFDPVDIEYELTGLLGRSLTEPLIFTESMDLRGPAGRAWMQTLQLIDSAARSHRNIADGLPAIRAAGPSPPGPHQGRPPAHHGQPHRPQLGVPAPRPVQFGLSATVRPPAVAHPAQSGPGAGHHVPRDADEPSGQSRRRRQIIHRARPSLQRLALPGAAAGHARGAGRERVSSAARCEHEGQLGRRSSCAAMATLANSSNPPPSDRRHPSTAWARPSSAA